METLKSAAQEAGSVARNPRRWIILMVLCLATLVLVIDNMALTVAVPALTEDLGATPQNIQWVMESYILVFAGLLLTSGSLSDRFGRRKVMVLGLALFGLASLAGAFASDPGQLIAARTVMGIGGALIMPSTLSILMTVFDADELRKAMAVWGSVSMLGLIGGPVMGGALVTHFSWGAVFLINVPVAVVAILAALFLMPESKGAWKKADPVGALLSVIGMVALIWTINELPKGGLSNAGTVVSLIVAVVGLGAFVAWELKVDEPMVPLRLFRDRNFAGGSLSLTLVQVGNGGMLLVVTQYVQFVLGYSPTEAGSAFIPMAVAALAFNGLGATLGQKIGNRAMAAIGLLVLAGGFVLLGTVDQGDSFLMLAAAMVAVGAGAGLAMPAAITALMGAIPAEHAGVGSALNDTIQQAGAALGVAALGSILTTGYAAAMPESAPAAAKHSIGEALAMGDSGLAQTARDAFTSGVGTTFLLSAAGVLVAAAVAFLMMRDPKPAPAPSAAAPTPDQSLLTTAS
ncbi:MFS transporter [Streptomyces spiroverticillatus]|uniref:MFS transporter n=1 Tax=Streptomyces finlayi TaxID=67296 RepID=A0A919C858_9ACTN|nr:MFS transporter [Streptomyces finlayi]GGZ98428.1 MFS transporter [Streptomyces spiroverticillatus]GHC83324.1 MFS transporter [Streptomyces finlayi]